LAPSCSRVLAAAILVAIPSWGADGKARSAVRPVHITSVVRSDQRTGKLVRSVVVTGKPAAERKPAQSAAPGGASPAATATSTSPVLDVDAIIRQIADQQSLPPQLIQSVIKVESNFNPYAVSPKGALGMMQLIPDTARRFGVSDVFDPEDNIRGGAKYLKYLLDLYDGNYPLALAAYNAGEGAVARYGTVPPYPETRNYIKLVARQLEERRPEQAAKPKEPESLPKVSDGIAHIHEVVEPDGTVRYVSQ
jgi:soluble lytic murein transglycosylase-like protein